MRKLARLAGITMLALTLMTGGIALAQQDDSVAIVITVPEEVHINIVQESLAIDHIPGSTGWVEIGVITLEMTDTGSRSSSSLKATGYSPTASPEWDTFIAAGNGLRIDETSDYGFFEDEVVVDSILPASDTEGAELLSGTFVTPLTQTRDFDVMYEAANFEASFGAMVPAGDVPGALNLFYSYTE